MTVRDIVVAIDPTDAGEARLKLALNLARTHAAHLTGVYVMPETHNTPGVAGFGPLPPAGTDGISGVGLGNGGGLSYATGFSREAERAENAERHFVDELRFNGVEGDWSLVDDGDSEALIEVAKSADLTVLGQRSPGRRTDGAARLRPDAVVVAVGRPVLVVPYAGAFENVGKRVLVAWDGTREANRAVNDALPLLDEAEAVTVMFVGSQETSLERTRPSLERIVRHLQLHEIEAKPEETLRGGLAVSDILLSRAADLAVDLIVAGGYHHSQIREALLGGVSRELLEHMTVPVLMSH